MARKGIAPLSTTIACAFTSGSSTTNQGPKPKKITAARIKLTVAPIKKMRQARPRGRETTAGLSGVAMTNGRMLSRPAAAVNRRYQLAVLQRVLLPGLLQLKPVPAQPPTLDHPQQSVPWSSLQLV